MTEFAQTITVASIVLGAIVYLVLRARKKSACGKGGDCGCTPRKPL
jgi:hypothetical protein